MKIAILGSTRGTDLQGIIDAIGTNELKDVEISFVLSNKKNAYILERARNHKIKDIFLNPKEYNSREDYDNKVTELCKNHNVELIVLIGYMKLMSSEFVQKWLNKVMNIHPSLLPAFEGGMDLNVHEAVLKRGCKYTGASLIFIDEGADTGPIISQEIVPVDYDDTPDTLKTKVQAVEQKLLINGIQSFVNGNMSIVNGNKVIIKTT